MERAQFKNRPIGLLDSGVGGLTVYKQFRKLMPSEDIISFGDSARLPYGTKSPETITRYAIQATRLLLQAQIKLLVTACNTISAQALPGLAKVYPSLPCLGVIEPGAQEAANISASGNIVVLATESTERSGAYPAAIKRYRPDAQVTVLGCNLLVGIAEQGWHEDEEARVIVARYLNQIDGDFDTVVLGCTHFPLLEATIRKLVGPGVTIVNSATTTAAAARKQLDAGGLLNDRPDHTGQTRFWATDTPECFARIAKPFLNGETLPAVEHVDIPNDNSLPSLFSRCKHQCGKRAFTENPTPKEILVLVQANPAPPIQNDAEWSDEPLVEDSFGQPL